MLELKYPNLIHLPTAYLSFCHQLHRFRSGQVSAEKTSTEGERKRAIFLYMVLSSDQPHQKNGRGCIFDKRCKTKFLPHRDPWDPLALP